ncbi:MAG: stage II sporulation protein M [Streptosporangiaceae bacterium]
MDVDAFVVAHRAEWERLERLIARRRRLSGEEVDELVDLYRRVTTQLSVVRSNSPDPMLVSRLSALVARTRAAVTGVHAPAWRDAARFLTVTFPAAAYRVRWWWLSTAFAFLAVATLLGTWVVVTPRVRSSVGTSEQIRRLINHDFEHYYSAHPATAFAAEVWTNNAWVAALSLTFGILLGIPTVWMLWSNAFNVGVQAGLFVAYGRAEVFFGLILPHGLLELTAVFLAAATGLRLGWTVIDPGRRRRADALAEEGRVAASIAIGLVLVLLVSGAVEAFVTPSPLPTAARVGIGAAVEAAFLSYVIVLGRRAVRIGETGDLPIGRRPDAAPTAG